MFKVLSTKTFVFGKISRRLCEDPRVTSERDKQRKYCSDNPRLNLKVKVGNMIRKWLNQKDMKLRALYNNNNNNNNNNTITTCTRGCLLITIGMCCVCNIYYNCISTKRVLKTRFVIKNYVDDVEHFSPTPQLCQWQRRKLYCYSSSGIMN